MKTKKNISPTMCAFPWMHLHAWPDGKAMLCCIAHGGKKRGEVGDFSTHSYKEIMNSEKMKQVRLDLMDGKQIPECEVCWKDESLGKQSFRRNSMLSANYNIHDLLLKTHPDGTIDDPKMLYMDFRFSNLCNLGCQTCGSPLSSTIANNRKDNTLEINHLKSKNVLSERGTITSFVYARPNFMEEDVYPYLDDCREFYFAGGEPLMHQEHFDILQYLNDNKLYNKQISYSTNLTLTKWKGVDFIEIWKNFHKMLFWCSIDGQGDQLEYIREFSKHNNVFKNLDKILTLKESSGPEKQYKVCICYTHSIYNAYYTKEFFQFMYDSGFMDRVDSIDINYAYSIENSVSILPDFAKTELKEKRKLDRESEVMQYAFTKFGNLEHYFDTIDSIIDEKGEPQAFDKLITYKLEDQKEKIEKALPWLASVIKRHRVI